MDTFEPQSNPSTERSLGRVEGKLDVLLNRVDKLAQSFEHKAEKSNTQHIDLLGRIVVLEQRLRYTVIGGVALAAAYAGDLKSAISALFKAAI